MGKVLRKKYHFKGLGTFEKGTEPTAEIKAHKNFSNDLLEDGPTKAKPKAKKQVEESE